MSQTPQQAPQETLYFRDLLYPHPPGWSPERIRRLHLAELSLASKPEFRHLSLLEVPHVVHREVPAEIAAQLRAQLAAEQAPAKSPIIDMGPAARKRARRAAAARHNEQALLTRQPAANDD